MTTTLTTFDAGVPPNTVVAGTNGIDAILEGSQIYNTGFHGAACVRAGSAANTASSRFRVALGVSGNHSGSVYLRNNTAHGSGSAGVNFFYLVSSVNTILARFRAGPSSAFQILVNDVIVRSGSLNEIPVAAWCRFDWKIVGTAMDWRYFYDPEAAAASTPDLSGSITTVSATPNGVVLAAQSTSAIIKDWSFDTVRADDSGAWFDGFAPPEPAAEVAVWNGATEDPATLTVWNGTTEVAAEWEIVL